MPIDSHITDPRNARMAWVDATDGEQQAAIVATRPLKTFSHTIKSFINSDYGVEMNQDASLGGVDENVHDGLDNPYWDGTSIVGGKFTFNSLEQFHAGARSVKTDDAAINDVMQFAAGANLDVSGYVAISMWIYVDKDWKAGDSIKIYGYDIGVGQVGNAVNLEDYFSWGIFKVWHNVIIPVADMDLSTETIDALRIEIVSKEGKSPKFYVDELKFKQTGTPLEYCIEPDEGTWLHVTSMMTSIVDAMAGTLASGTMPALAYNKLLAEAALPAGITYQRIKGGEITAYTSHQLSDFLSFPNTTLSSAISDGTNTMVNIQTNPATPIILKSEDDDMLCIKISDDLTGLLSLRVAAAGMVEKRA